MEILTVPEAAKKMHVTRETIYAWIRTNKITPVMTPGGRIRIPVSELIKPFQVKAKTGLKEEHE